MRRCNCSGDETTRFVLIEKAGTGHAFLYINSMVNFLNEDEAGSLRLPSNHDPGVALADLMISDYRFREAVAYALTDYKGKKGRSVRGDRT